MWKLWRDFFLFTKLLLFCSATIGQGLIMERSMATQMRYKQDFLYDLPLWAFLMQNFANSYFLQGHFRHKSSFVIWQERRDEGKGTGASTWSVKLWKVRGVIWHIILWCTWKFSPTTCQSIFSVNVFLYCIIFLNNEDFYFTSALFFCCLTFFWSYI